MSDTLEPQMELTPEDHLSPNGQRQRIQDTDKARYMAEGMNPNETKAVELRQELAQTALASAIEVNHYAHGQPIVEMGVQARNGTLTSDIQRQQELADRKANDLADVYDALQGSKR